MFRATAFKSAIRAATQRRAASSGSAPSVEGKSFKEIWLGDTGAYPIMGVIVFAGVFASSAIAYFNTIPDVQWSKTRRTHVLRGELLQEEIAAEKGENHAH